MPHLLIIYSILLVLASTLGGLLPSLVQFTHRRIQMTLSLVSGVMLGVAMLHMLPHSAKLLGDVHQATLFSLVGLLVMFLMIRLFHFHQHDITPENEVDHACDHQHCLHSGELELPHSSHHHESANTGGVGKVAAESTVPVASNGQLSLHEIALPQVAQNHTAHQPFSWLGLTVGLGLHTLMDGLALAAAYTAESAHSGMAGMGTFLAIVLHKPLDSLTITSLMAAHRATFRQQTIVNLVFSLVCPLGALLFAITFQQWGDVGPLGVGFALAFSAGVFLCISLGDILPEVHFHSHDRFWLSAMLLAGVIIAWLIEIMPGHSHG